MRTNGLRPLLDEWAWQAHGACRGLDSSLFFAPATERGAARREREERAQEICSSCPVRPQCAAFSLATGQGYGVWGGLTEKDRTRKQPARTTSAA